MNNRLLVSKERKRSSTSFHRRVGVSPERASFALRTTLQKPLHRSPRQLSRLSESQLRTKSKTRNKGNDASKTQELVHVQAFSLSPFSPASLLTSFFNSLRLLLLPLYPHRTKPPSLSPNEKQYPKVVDDLCLPLRQLSPRPSLPSSPSNHHPLSPWVNPPLPTAPSQSSITGLGSRSMFRESIPPDPTHVYSSRQRRATGG